MKKIVSLMFASVMMLFAQGQGQPPSSSVAQAFQETKKKCDTGEDYGDCVIVGINYYFGVSGVIDKSEFEALKYFKIACDNNMPDGCNNLGMLYTQGRTTDLSKAKEAFEKGCRLSSGKACLNLGTMYAKGDGVAMDEMRALKIFENACALGSREGCVAYDAYRKASGL